MPSISLCMMVKDEAATLAAAILSVKGVVSEVVVGVDESCTDDTPLIARDLASKGKLFTFKWDDDFSRIRNEVIKRADGDLILILDGHEIIAPDDHPIVQTMARMRGAVAGQNVPTPLGTLSHIAQNGLPNDSTVCCITTCMNVDPAGIPQLMFLQPRLFANNGIHYSNKVHNALAGYDKSNTCAYRDCLLIHNMPPAREEKRKVQRKKMNVTGLFADAKEQYAKEKAYIAEHGEKMPLAQTNARPFFYLGNTYADQGNSAKALYWYRQYLPRSGFGDEKYQALQQLSVLAHRHEKDVDQAMAYAQEAERLCWNRAEPCVLRAEICMEKKDYAQAIHWLDRAESFVVPDTVMFLQGAVYSYLPSVQKAKCYLEMNDWTSAMRELQTALSWRPGDPELINQLMSCKDVLRRKRSTPNILIADRIGSFTNDIAQHYANKDWTVVKREQCDLRWKGWADIAWFEWCDDGIVEWSREPWSCPVICRLHSYEAYTDWPGQVNWNNVDHLVFVSEHIRQIVFQRWPHIKDQVNTSIIHNGVDPTKLTYREREAGNKIAFLGYINHKKSPDGLATLARMYPKYEFHVGGQPQEANTWDDFLYQIADLPNVYFHGWIDEKDNWLEDMNYLVSPSVIESFGYTIAEAALKGIKPLVRHRIGARDLWPAEWIYRGPQDLQRLLDAPYDSASYRQWILDHYTLDHQIELTDELIHILLAGTNGPQRTNYIGHPLHRVVELD